MSGKRKGAILCSHNGKWKSEVEERLQIEGRVTLTALGKVKYKVLRHLQERKDIEVIKLQTKYMKKKEKGVGLKVTVRRLDKHKPAS